MSQGTVGQVREHLLYLRVAAAMLLGLQECDRRVGKHDVVGPVGEQFALALGCLRAEVFDPADDQPVGDRLAFGEVKAR